jgi:hypothetical protein
MRVFFGIILGIIITLGGAYIHDVNIPPPPAPPTDPSQPTPPDLGPRRIVNWDVLSAITHEQTEFVREQWNKIFH